MRYLSCLPRKAQPILTSEVMDVKTRPFRLRMLIVLLVAILCVPALSTTEEDCPCHDRPGPPCVRQRITLEDIAFPVGNAAHDKYLYEPHQNSEVWILIETIPSGGCRACAQTFILYAPNRDVQSDETYHLFTTDDVALTCSKVIFSMIECSPVSSLTMRMAIIEEDAGYSDCLDSISPYLSKGLLFGQTGDPDGSDAEATGWSARVDGAWLDTLADVLGGDAGNQVILSATSAASVTMDGSTTERNVWEFRDEDGDDRWVQLTVRGTSQTVDCDLTCSGEDVATQAETHLAGTKLCDLATFALTAQSGYTEVTSGASLPANVVKQETSVKKETRTSSSGTRIEYVFVVRVLRFRDGSVYVESYAIKRVIGADGRMTETIRDCLQATSQRGFDRYKIRSLLETAEQTRTTHAFSGGSPSSALVALAPPDAACGVAAMPERLDLSVPSNAVLDLTSLVSPRGVAQPQILAWESITIHADAILLPEGCSIERMVYPTPELLPSEDKLVLMAPEAVAVSSGTDRIDVVVTNGSGTESLVSLFTADTQGWTDAEERNLLLAPGEAVVLTFTVQTDESATGRTGFLTITATADGLPHVMRVVELRVVGEEMASSDVAGVTIGAITVPEQIEAYARILAWKGGQLGRADPWQRWSASEDDPGEYCEPCGHAPMCQVCMEWDLEQWQFERDKTATDVLALSMLLSYLSSVAGQSEVQAVASIYWDAHWDGWNNRDRPW